MCELAKIATFANILQLPIPTFFAQKVHNDAWGVKKTIRTESCDARLVPDSGRWCRTWTGRGGRRAPACWRWRWCVWWACPSAATEDEAPPSVGCGSTPCTPSASGRTRRSAATDERQLHIAVCYSMDWRRAAVLTCWSACADRRWPVVGWMAMAVGQELYTGSVQWSWKQQDSSDDEVWRDDTQRRKKAGTHFEFVKVEDVNLAVRVCGGEPLPVLAGGQQVDGLRRAWKWQKRWKLSEERQLAHCKLLRRSSISRRFKAKKLEKFQNKSFCSTFKIKIYKRLFHI